MNRKAITLTALAALMSCVQSCNKDQLPVTPNMAITPETTNQLQIAFGKTLGKALKADPALRKFLKVESLKRFDQDYDILYQMVKDNSIDGQETLRERLAQYASSADELASIEQLPLLTIFVPSLPGGFSAETWQPDSQIPSVAIRQIDTNKVPLFGENGKEAIIQPGDIPGFPVVVIKQNERVMISAAPTIGNSEIPSFYRNQQFSFSFTAPAFDGLHAGSQAAKQPTLSASTLGPPNHTTNRVALPPGYTSEGSEISGPDITAFQIGLANPGFEWQRDFVYYGLTPTNLRGPLNTNFRETIRAFRLSNEGISRMAGYPDDPKNPEVGSTSGNASAWTDGSYEFLVAVLTNAKDGTPPQANIRFGARPDQLYYIAYEQYSPWYWPWSTYYRVTTVTPKEFFPNIPIATWDLKNFGTAWLYHIYEENQTVDVTTTSTVSTTYATNFDLSGTVFKIGAKFGASASTTSTNSVTLHYTQGSTDFGEKVSYFYDPIIVSKDQTWYGGDSYNTYDLAPGGAAGFVFLSVEPYSLDPVENNRY